MVIPDENLFIWFIIHEFTIDFMFNYGYIMESIAKALKLASFRKNKKQKRLKPIGTEELAKRYTLGLDLWTGLSRK